MSAIAAFSSEALRKSLEQILDGLELELVYPKQSDEALTDPSKRVPGMTAPGFAQLKYLFSFAVKLSIPDSGSLPPGKSFFEMDDSGRIYINNLGVMLDSCDIKLALMFTGSQDFSMPFALPFNLPIAIPISTPPKFSDSVLGAGTLVNVPRIPFANNDLFHNQHTSLFGSAENGLTLNLQLNHDKLAEISLDMKPVVVSTSRTVKVAQADGSEIDTNEPCWGLSFDEFLVSLNLVPLGITLLELLFDPLQQKAIDFATDGLATALADDPLFIFTNASLSEIADYIAACVDEQAAEAAIPGFEAAVSGAQLLVEVDQQHLKVAKAFGVKKFIDDAQGILDEDNKKLSAAQQLLADAQQKVAEDKVKEQAALGPVVDAARGIMKPIVKEFFNLQEQGATFLLSFLQMVADDLSKDFFAWFDSGKDFSGVLAGLMQDFLREKINFSLVPQTIETDFSGKLPDKLKGRLKLLPLDIDISTQPLLTIQKKEMSLVVEIDG